MGFIINSLAWLSGWFVLILQALMIASSLYLAAELAEEAITPLRKILQKSLVVMVVLYLLLWFDGVPSLNVLVGIAAHLSFIPILKNFPYVHTMSPTTWIPLGLLLLNHFVWFRYFIELKQESMSKSYYSGYNKSQGGDDDDYSFTSIAGFLFLFVWMIPLGFFISVMDVEEALPSANIGGASRSGMRRGSSSASGSYAGSNDYYNYPQNNMQGDGMLDYQNDYNSTGGNMSMPVPTGDDRRRTKGGILKKIMDPLKAKKDMFFTKVAVPIRKDK